MTHTHPPPPQNTHLAHMVPAMHHLVGVHLRVYEKCTLAQILRMKIAPPSNGDLFHPARKGQQSIPVIFVFYPLLFFSFIFIQISSKLKILKEEGRRKLICIIYKRHSFIKDRLFMGDMS